MKYKAASYYKTFNHQSKGLSKAAFEECIKGVEDYERQKNK